MLAGFAISLFAMIKRPLLFKYYTMISFTVLYLVALFEAGNDFMFLLMFPITMMYVLYFDYRFIWVTSILLGLANVADVVIMIVTVGTFRSGMALEVPVLLLRMGSMFISLAALIGTTSRANRNNANKIASVKAEQEKSMELVNIIVPVVKSVRENSLEVNEAIVENLHNNAATAKDTVTVVVDTSMREAENIQDAQKQLKTEKAVALGINCKYSTELSKTKMDMLSETVHIADKYL